MELNIFIVMWAGILSFFAPCVLPLYPTYLSYMTGLSVKELEKNSWQKQVHLLVHSLSFLFGFSTVFFFIGLSATLIGDVFFEYNYIIQLIGGILIILMGLFMLGFIKWNWLFKEKKWHYQKKAGGYFSSYLIGLSFGSGWTPCIGPILATVLSLLLHNPDKGVLMLVFYILGFSMPFLLLTFFIPYVKVLQKYSNKIMKVSGVVIILFGIILMTGQMDSFSQELTKLFGSNWFSEF